MDAAIACRNCGMAKPGSALLPISRRFLGTLASRADARNDEPRAAGAKDLLFVSAAPQQVHRAFPSCANRPKAGPSLARIRALPSSPPEVDPI